MKDTTHPFLIGAVLGFMLAAALNTLPFADAAKYRAAIKECEKSIPRDQHCTVIGIKPDATSNH